MFSFGKKEVAVQTATVTVPKNLLDAIWASYWEKKEVADALDAEIAALKAEIIAACQDQELFKGQTATCGLNKVSVSELPRLILPKNFDVARFAAEFPQLMETKINSSKISKLLEDADARTKLESYDLDVEFKASYTLKKG